MIVEPQRSVLRLDFGAFCRERTIPARDLLARLANGLIHVELRAKRLKMRAFLTRYPNPLRLHRGFVLILHLMPDPMRSYLDFEKPVAELDAKVDELRALAATGSDIGDEISRIEDKAAQALSDLYANLTPWQKTLVARHPQRPHFADFINALITEFTPLAGDRKFGEDEALMGGFGRFRGESICVIGQEKGATTEIRHQA